jgi:hypothetical protein
MKRWRRIFLTIITLVILLSGCGDRVVVDRDGIGTERDVMIAEAAENTRAMESTTDDGNGR